MPAEEAFLAAIAVAQQQKARSFELRAAISLAKLYKSRGRAADAHAVLAPALKGFSATLEFPEIEQAQELLAALAATDQVRNAAATRERRLKLQTSYGQALIWSKGWGAEETKVAFTRAKELATAASNAAERFQIYYGLAINSLLRGELQLARQTAEMFLREAKTEGVVAEAAVASRILGVACLYQGEFTKAQAHLEEALRIYDPKADLDATVHFAQDHRAATAAFLALATWVLGEVGRARELIDGAIARAVEAAHPPTLANIPALKALLEILRGDAEATQRSAERAIKLAQEHGLTNILRTSTLYASWAHARLGNPGIGATELREALVEYRDEGNRIYVPLLQGLLAELEAEVEDAEKTPAGIDDALSLARQTGEHWTDAFLHRLRGEILFMRNPVNTAEAEEAFLAAIAVAQQQKARSFELRAALALAKLYQSTGRAADAHAVLAPSLVGFSPTPEFPEIEEAQALRAALAETHEVKNAAVSRQRRLQLQTSYGQALLWSRGFGSEEAKAALDRGQELAAGTDSAAARFPAYYGKWVSCSARGEIGLARQIAERFLREAKIEGRMVEAAVASRNLGLTCFWQGDFTEAKANLEEALLLCDAQHDPKVNVSFGQDTIAAAKAFLAKTSWALGEVTRARELIEQAIARAVETTHAPTLVNAYWFKASLEVLRGDADGALRDATRVIELSREHGIAHYCGTRDAVFQLGARTSR